MWLAQYYVLKAKSIEDLEHVINYLRWAASHAAPSGILAEQINPYTGEPISVSPLTWSHAEVVQTVMNYLEKLQELHTCNECGRSIFRYDRAGRQQIKNRTITHTDGKPFHYLNQINIRKGAASINLNVDQRRCVGCGICTINAKGTMDIVDDKAKIIAERAQDWDIKPEFEKCCPMKAITVNTNEDPT